MKTGFYWLSDYVTSCITYAAAYHRVTSGTGSTAAADEAKVAWYNQCRQYRGILHDKRSSFWRETTEAERASPRKLQQSHSENQLPVGNRFTNLPFNKPTHY